MVENETPVSIVDCLIFSNLIRYHMNEEFKTIPEVTSEDRADAMEGLARCIMKALFQVANAEREGVRIQSPILEEDLPTIARIKALYKAKGIVEEGE